MVLVGTTCHCHLLFLGCPVPGPAISHLVRVPRLCQVPSQNQRRHQRGWCREQASEEGLRDFSGAHGKARRWGSECFSISLLHWLSSASLFPLKREQKGRVETLRGGMEVRQQRELPGKKGLSYFSVICSQYCRAGWRAGWCLFISLPHIR